VGAHSTTTIAETSVLRPSPEHDGNALRTRSALATSSRIGQPVFVGLRPDDSTELTMGSLTVPSRAPDPERYSADTMPNLVAYLCSFGALFLPPLGVAGLILAIRGWRAGRRGAAIAAAVAVLATTLGIFAWVTLLAHTQPVSPNFVGTSLSRR